jgi:hypothetical protein
MKHVSKRVKLDIKKKDKFGSMTLPERIAVMETELKRSIDALPLYNYFSKISNNKNSYVVEMRKVIAEILFSKDYTIMEISKVLCKDHASVLHFLGIESNSNVKKVVSENYTAWLSEDVYPTIKRKTIPDADNPRGYRTVLDYTLKKIK